MEFRSKCLASMIVLGNLGKCSCSLLISYQNFKLIHASQYLKPRWNALRRRLTLQRAVKISFRNVGLDAHIAHIIAKPMHISHYRAHTFTHSYS